MSSGPKVPDQAVAELSRILLERAGLKIAPDGTIGLRMAIAARLDATGEQDAVGYVRRLETSTAELRGILPLVTVGKTDFFRDPNQFRALRNTLVPEALARARREHRKLRIWSAGCATGEEPYSLAMLATELGVLATELDLLATDVNPKAVEAAETGRFTARRLAAVAPELRAHYFVERPDGFYASAALRSLLRFQPHNLAVDAYPLPTDGEKWDLILCRNVIIYFDGPTTVKVVSNFYDRLVPDGVLLLGYSESLYRLFGEFDLAEVEGAFVYRKPRTPHPAPLAGPRQEEVIANLRVAVAQRRQNTPARPLPRPAPKPVPAARPQPPPIAAQLPAPSPPSAQPPAEANPLSSVITHVEQGEFEPALAELRSALTQAPGNLALQITLGNVYAVMGRVQDARAAYQAAIAAEPLCAEAHLFLGICSSEAGSSLEGEALKELGRATFLDPNLALAHYYAGRIAERRGDVSGARRAYKNAIAACRGQKGRSPFLGHYPDLPTDPNVLSRAVQYALAAIEESA